MINTFLRTHSIGPFVCHSHRPWRQVSRWSSLPWEAYMLQGTGRWVWMLPLLQRSLLHRPHPLLPSRYKLQHHHWHLWCCEWIIFSKHKIWEVQYEVYKLQWLYFKSCMCYFQGNVQYDSRRGFYIVQSLVVISSCFSKGALGLVRPSPSWLTSWQQ